MNTQEFIKKIQSLGDIYESAKDAVHGSMNPASSDMTAVLHALGDMRNIAVSALQEANETKSIIALEADRFEWAMQTFPEATAISSLRKLEGEIKEIESDIQHGVKNPIEFADALMCLFDSAGRHGISPQQIFNAFSVKLRINKSRKWVKNEDNSYSHVK